MEVIMEKLNPFESDLSIQAIQVLTFLDGGGSAIGEKEKKEIIQYLKNYGGGLEMLIDLIFELVNEGFLVLNSL